MRRFAPIVGFLLGASLALCQQPNQVPVSAATVPTKASPQQKNSDILFSSLPYANHNDTNDGSCAMWQKSNFIVLTATKNHGEWELWMETINIDMTGKVLSRTAESFPMPEKPTKRGHGHRALSKTEDVPLFKQYCTWANNPGKKWMVPEQMVVTVRAYTGWKNPDSAQVAAK